MRTPTIATALSLALFLAGCADLNPFGGDEPPPPMPPHDQLDAADSPELASDASSMVLSAPVAAAPLIDPNLPMAELWAGERAAERFITLHRLVLAGLVDPERYQSWAQANEGALLVTTAPPPVKGMAVKIPPYDEVAGYLNHIKNDREDIAAAERAALLTSLMPQGAARAAALRPPKSADMARWEALLDRVAAEGALPADKIAAEKAVLAITAR
jgi:hypothetical protein